MPRTRSSFPSLLPWLLLSLCAVLAACASAPAAKPAEDRRDTASTEEQTPYPSTYKPLPSRPVLITNATVLTAVGDRIEGGSVLMRDGRIAAVGRSLQAPADATVIDAAGKWVTPGIIDAHSHLGAYPAPGVDAHQDGNEATDPVTAQVWVEHSIWPQDPQFPLSLAGGVTAMQILPGSANLIGGRTVTIKNVPARSVQAMKFPGAPHGLKMACGENPKRVYGNRNRSPATRMGNVAGYRQAFYEARNYQDEWESHRRERGEGEDDAPPEVDLDMETLSGALDGDILLQIHCYRADEMMIMMDLAEEFGMKIAAFHHAVEAYKIADHLAEKGVCADMWADWWGFKMEALDGIRENIPLVEKAGGCAVVHSDSSEGIQRLNQEAAKAMAAGNRMGMSLRPEDAIRWITINPARSIGIADQTGSLEEGKMADVVIWSGNPFSVYSKAERVFIDGALIYDRNDPARQPRMDFELGLVETAGGVQ